jgi:O-antigen ligase
MIEFNNIQTTALKIGSCCAVLLIPAIYFSTALAIFLSAIIALLWLVSAQFLRLPNILKDYPVALWSLLLFACFVIGFSYGDASNSEAFSMLRKYRELVFIPLLLPFLIREPYRQWAWYAFIVASVVTLLSSQLMAMDLFCVNELCTPHFKSRITHGVFIAFFAFFISHKAFDTRGWIQLSCIALLLICLHNLFFVVDGRTGQLIFLVLMLLFAMQRFNKKNLLLAMLAIVVLLGVFISFSDKAIRIKEGFATAQAHLQDHPEQGEFSMGERFTFWKYSAQLIAEKPFFGQGTGSYTKAYQRVANKDSQNPHNEFLLIGVQLGAIGLFFYSGFLLSQYYYATRLPTPEKWLAQGLLATLIITSLFNSPLLDHTEGHWFTTLIALCFATQTINKQKSTNALYQDRA